MGDGVA